MVDLHAVVKLDWAGLTADVGARGSGSALDLPAAAVFRTIPRASEAAKMTVFGVGHLHEIVAHWRSPRSRSGALAFMAA